MLNRADIEQAINDVLDARNRVDAETHHEHHEWIQAQIKRENKRTEMYEKIGTSVAQWGILAILGLIWAYLTGDKSLLK